jgi:hypothetical protein
MKKKQYTMHPYVQKAVALFVLALLFLGVASVRADGPYPVSWGIETFTSEAYNMQDLTFVWSGQTGNAVSREVTGCSSVEDCLFETTYDESGTYAVQVYAKNSSGETVSNTASCTANVATQCPCSEGYTCVNNYCQSNLVASCGAYSSEDAEFPNEAHNPGSEIWWKVAVTGGEGPYTYSWSTAVTGTGNPRGPFYIATVDGNPGDYQIDTPYTANVIVTDLGNNNEQARARCSFYAKECAYDTDCQILGYPDLYTCSAGKCVPPPIVFAEQLQINPSVVREDERCGLSWAADYADECTLYKNNEEVVDSAVGTSTTNYMVGPGSYHVICQTFAEPGSEIITDTETAGPVRCIYNPNVRES